MRLLQGTANVLTIATLVVSVGMAMRAESEQGRQPRVESEDYLHVPVPPGFRVEATESDGPVFADPRGRTLYRWPLKTLRSGDAGERRGGAPVCDDHPSTETAGLMSPYPPGLTLPELDKRPSCTQVWPPVLASDSSMPVGKWGIVKRKDGSKQWTYDGYPLYTSSLDQQPGDVFGVASRKLQFDSPAVREPIGPPMNVPPEFAVMQVATGRLLVTHVGFSVYTWDKDAPNKSNCTSICTQEWRPVLAPATVQPQGEWTIIERSPGIKQWAFRKRPLYTRVADVRLRSFEGSDTPGWHNVYTHRAPEPPKGFTVQDSASGQVLADSHGMTIYVYACDDDSSDQLACDHPTNTQVYRFAICGGGDPMKCLQTFPPVLAPKDAKVDRRIWSVMDIDPNTGHLAAPGQANALHVWAYRQRPVYTFVGDRRPGDINADGWGEVMGWRNGFKAFWLRDDFFSNAG